MGCTNSKIDDLEAVVLCRQRCDFLDEAIQLRYLLAETHIEYVHSLEKVGQSLHNFINNNGGGGGGGGELPSPMLNLPPTKKGGTSGGNSGGVTIREVAAGKGGAHHSHSNSGGHIEFHSDPDDDESGSESGLSHHSSPLHDHDYPEHVVNYMSPDTNYWGADPETLGGYTHNTHMNYMKNEAKPSIVYQQKPMSPKTVQYHQFMSESSSSSSYYPPSYPYPYPSNSNSNSSSNPYFGYPNQPPSYGVGYGGGAPSYGGGGGNYGLPPTYGDGAGAASSSKPPPPPPSPPRASPWEFLNFFDSYGGGGGGGGGGGYSYPPQYTPGRDLKELREAEGIPDLEDENFPHEPVNKVNVAEKFVVGGGGGKGGGGGVVGGDESIGSSSIDSDADESPFHTRPSVDGHDGVEYDVHVVEKKVVDGERSGEQRNAARANSRDAADVVGEIKFHFERASVSGSEIAKILEAGKLPYGRKHVASKMLHVVTPSLSVVASQPSTSKSAETSSSSNDKAGPAYLDIDEDLALRTKKLSSTLHKLHLWEKKLYNEVKAEEKMRLVHDRKVSKLKRMDERGAEAHKVDTTRTLIRSLSTKIRIAIQVVDKISVTINKIRDEELWPQLNELIQGLTRMWKSMLECHRSQCQAIREAKSFGPVGSGKMPGNANLEATSQLEQELLNWTYRFSSWIDAQKGYVRALNNWLLKSLLYEPEETADGIVPFSPGRIGAPPIFVICNQWSQALDRISEKEVIDSMRVLAMGVFQLWEQDMREMRQRMLANKDMERHVKKLDRDDYKMQKQIQALDKKIVLVSGNGNTHLVNENVVYQSDTSSSNLQGSLQRIFEAMERFTADSVKAYEELLQRTQEERQRPLESERIP
ncbi:hypothetical protein Ddye_004278 [Dipteronia dyeriana]|uniref:Uncharacterized protein n=1 Tax=Dipteronia dyeriana TaxID=168575 RepID=A0AAD9XTV7_9ROSI|nr:hypothetical protein Ddye_004278 [Dipteronia dyeriana]